MSTHPFFPYLGLGLLDEASIRRDASRWNAQYLDAGSRHLQVTVHEPGPSNGHGSALIKEFSPSGDHIATSLGRDLHAAIAQHATTLLTERPCRLWDRVGELTPSVYIPLQVEQPVMGFVPAMAIGWVCIPSPLDAPWLEPTPGPLARHLGLTYACDPFGPRFATLLRATDASEASHRERVRLREYDLPAILVPEFAKALQEARGPLTSLEWRPVLRVNLAPNEVRIFDSVERYGATYEGRPLMAYALVPEQQDDDIPRPPDPVERTPAPSLRWQVRQLVSPAPSTASSPPSTGAATSALLRWLASRMVGRPSRSFQRVWSSTSSVSPTIRITTL